MVTIHNQQYGVEIETAGVARHIIAEAVATATGGTISSTHAPGYDATIVTDPQAREWKIQNDSSIVHMQGVPGSEVVSPILTYEDIPLLQSVIRKLREVGAKTPNSTSCHIHVSAQPHTPQSLARLAKMVFKNEEIIFDALKVRPDRRQRYCRPMDTDFISRLNQTRPQNDQELNVCWFGQFIPHPEHHHRTRYSGLNYVNRWRELGTVEFRYFNFDNGLHAGKLKAWIQLCLALSAKAINSHAASHRRIPTDNPRFSFRVWLVSTLGMIGDEFKTARYHLTRYLPGNSAWRHGSPTIVRTQNRDTNP